MINWLYSPGVFASETSDTEALHETHISLEMLLSYLFTYAFICVQSLSQIEFDPLGE